MQQMHISHEILEQAMSRFDAAGIVPENGGSVLILGLESTRERNLDKMALKDGRMRLYGWTRHVKPRMLELMDVFKEKGFEAQPVGWWGYPSGEQIESPFCESCNACIDICPVEGLLEPYRLLAPSRCLVNIESILIKDRMGKCREACRTICPVGR
ncbi:MAG: hypothetical protein JRI34_02945 [Deltaproteobacteria bacterium]|nr:hypothetical protein [Deltaproteobacteria bacterium]